MDTATFISRVKAKMDELTPFNEGLVVFDGANTNPVFDTIEKLLDECIDEVLLLTPPHHLPWKNAATQSELTIVNGYGRIAMPPDFIKIARVIFQEWERPVTRAILESDPKYLEQKNRYTRAGVSKPVVALVQSGGQKVLECYTVTSLTGAFINYVYRLPLEEIPATVLPALEYYTASKAFSALGNTKSAEEMNKQFLQASTLRNL